MNSIKIRYTVPGIYTCHTLHTYTTLDARHILKTKTISLEYGGP